MKNRIRVKKFFKRPPVLITALLLVGLVLGWGLLWRQDKKLATLSPSSPTSASDASSPIPSDPTSGGNETKTTPQTPPPVTPPTGSSSSVSLEIRQTFQNDNGDVVIQTAIKGSTSGQCKLTLTQGGSTISKSSDVLYQSSFSTCKGFTVPLSEFSSGGSWQLNLTLESNGKQVASAQIEVVVNK